MSSAIEARLLAGDASGKVKISQVAGKPAPKEMLADLLRLEREYFVRRPDLNCPNQMVSFGISGRRGSSLDGTFTENHVLAITQAICDYRHRQGTDGPLYIGKDTHALSAPARRTAIEVLAANNVQTLNQQEDGVTPTPVISRAILVHNRGRKEHLADGIIITPSHNPPEDGGFKYNPPNGGPADTEVTRWVENRANELLAANNTDVKRVPYNTALRAANTHQEDFYLALRARFAERGRHGCDSRWGRQVGGRSARRSVATLLGGDQCGLRIRHRRLKSDSGSYLLIHDPRSRRQDPYGLLQPVCYGQPRCPEK